MKGISLDRLGPLKAAPQNHVLDAGSRIKKMRFSLTRSGPIGLDVGSQWVKAAQFTGIGGQARLSACAAFPRIIPGAAPTPDELGQIASILRRQGFTGRDVVIAAPGEKLQSGILELPAKAEGVPMDQLARAEFGRVHKLDMNGAELAWWELPASTRAAKGTVVMAVACPHADAEPFIASFENAGLRVGVADTPTSALARGCMPLVKGKRSFAVLEIGASAGVLVLILDGVVIYERRLAEAGISRLLTTLEEGLGGGRETADYAIREVGLTPGPERGEDRFGEARGLIARHTEAALAEVRRTLAYASHQYAGAAVEALLLCGGGAQIPGLCEYLAARVETTVNVVAFEQGMECSDEMRRRVGVYPACAVGLARFS